MELVICCITQLHWWDNQVAYLRLWSFCWADLSSFWLGNLFSFWGRDGDLSSLWWRFYFFFNGFIFVFNQFRIWRTRTWHCFDFWITIKIWKRIWAWAWLRKCRYRRHDSLVESSSRLWILCITFQVCACTCALVCAEMRKPREETRMSRIRLTVTC